MTLDHNELKKKSFLDDFKSFIPSLLSKSKNKEQVKSIAAELNGKFDSAALVDDGSLPDELRDLEFEVWNRLNEVIAAI